MKPIPHFYYKDVAFILRYAAEYIYINRLNQFFIIIFQILMHHICNLNGEVPIFIALMAKI
ncbi:hypothetical protein BGV56_01000 [Burkholderia ubonensis]|nr:hypothetical protein BGV56_01000 [Burkholderia ubonensis]